MRAKAYINGSWKEIKMMLKHDEKKYVRGILKLLEESELILLAKTVSLNMLVPRSAKEAVDIIVRYESSFQSFLQHKRVSREVLFHFMHSQQIPVLPKDDKKAMIIKIIEYLKQKPPASAKDEDTKHQNLKSKVDSSEQVYDQQTQIKNEKVNDVEHVCQQQQILRTSNTQFPGQCRRTEGNANDLAVEFSKWFYSMMNQESRIGLEHFWLDCDIKLHILAGGDIIEESRAQGAEECVGLLWEAKTQHRLLFNPNISAEGVRGIVEMHGLVMVLACGSLHQEQKCVGVFEQKFGLIRDPTALNNWKIKFTELFLRSTNTVKALPTLQDTELINDSSVATA